MTERDEMKRMYKEAAREMGVYQIRNTVSGKVLVAASANLNGPKNSHFFSLKMGSHVNKELQRDYGEFGPDAFVYEVLDTVKEREDLPALEEMWLEKLQPYGERGYNKEKRSVA
jgi:hypothetical protein